jgi:hypothetical protein
MKILTGYNINSKGYQASYAVLRSTSDSLAFGLNMKYCKIVWVNLNNVTSQLS